MAGDWIKMRVDLGDDPAVIQIACQLDIAEDDVVGKLHRLWSWADKHTTDGTAPAITAKWVDRYVDKSGFAEAMVAAHWISFNDSGVIFPEFDRHNGDSAKRRVEATLRQRLSRKNRDDGVTGGERTKIPRPFVRHVMHRDAFKCVFCGTESNEEKESSRKAIMSVDHLKPITRGGSAAVENLACACRACNSEKNDRTPEEWGLLPTFLQDGVAYEDGSLVTNKSQQNCDTNATREEKRREENIKPLKSKAEARGSRLPADWIAPEPYIKFCETERPDLNPMFMQDKFRDYWHPKPGKDGLKLDWLGTWRNFIRSERAPLARGSPARPEKFDPSTYIIGKRMVKNERDIEFDEHGQPL